MSDLRPNCQLIVMAQVRTDLHDLLTRPFWLP